MEEKNYERTRSVLTKGVKEWVDNEFITNPRKSWDSIQKTAYEIWNYLDLDGSGSCLNKKPNGEPIFYLNADDPNKLLEIGPNKTVGSVAVSLEGQIIAAVQRANIKFDTVPTKSSRHSHKPSENVWYKVEFDSVLNHIDYMWFTKYTDEGCPEKGKPFFRNAKGNLGNWPRGLTSLMKENEEIERAKKAEKEKEKRDKEKEIDEWIKGCGDGTGTKEGFILCQKYSQLVEEVKAEYPKRVADNDTGFIERTVRDKLKPDGAKAPEVKQATKKEVLGTEFNPTEVLEKMFRKDEGKEIVIKNLVFRKSEKLMGNIHCLIDGRSSYRSTGTKDRKEARVIHNKAKKMFKNSQMKMQPSAMVLEPAQEPAQTKPEPKENMRTTEPKPSFIERLFGRMEAIALAKPKVEVINEPNEELEETKWVEPDKPEPMKEVSYNVRDASGALMKSKDRILEITETLELKAKAKAFDELELTLVPHHIAAVETRLAELEQEKERLMKELGDDASK